MAKNEYIETSSEQIWQGEIVDLRVANFKHADGETVRREIVAHPGAVAVVVHDDQYVYLERQPREATGEFSLLEIPAGKTDVPGESPLETAKRELAEEIGKAANEWEYLTYFYVSPGIMNEKVHLFRATDLTDVHVKHDENERIELVKWPLSELAEAINQTHDSKSLVGLMLLQKHLSSS